MTTHLLTSLSLRLKDSIALLYLNTANRRVRQIRTRFMKHTSFYRRYIRVASLRCVQDYVFVDVQAV